MPCQGITKRGVVCNRMSKANLCSQHNKSENSAPKLPKVTRGRPRNIKLIDSQSHSKIQRQSHSITPPSPSSSDNPIIPSLFSTFPRNQEDIVFPSGTYTIRIQSDPLKADMLLDSIKYHNGSVSRLQREADPVCTFFSQTPISHVPIYTTLVLPNVILQFKQFEPIDENYVVTIQKDSSVDAATLSFHMNTNFYCQPNTTTRTISIVPILEND